MDNIFSVAYKRLNNAQLIEIIENPQNYQPMAIEAAELEITTRQLNSQNVEEIKAELKSKKLEEQRLQNKSAERKKEFKTKAFQVLEYVDPLVKKTSNKSIIIITFILLVIALFSIISVYSTFKYMFLMDEGVGFFSLDIIEAIYLPITIFLFWKKKFIGFGMLFFWLCFRIISTSIYAYYIFQIPEINGPMADLIKLPNLSTSITQIVFYGGLLYFINKPSIKSLYNPKTEKEPVIID